jgi:hypothetical protein
MNHFTSVFTPAELDSISGHLHVVADLYDDNVAELRQAKVNPDPGRDGPHATDVYERLACQFERQAVEARAFAARIDNLE